MFATHNNQYVQFLLTQPKILTKVCSLVKIRQWSWQGWLGCENNAKEDNGLRDDGQVQDPALDHYRLAVGTQKEKILLPFLFKAFYWRMALVQTNTVEYMTMQSTSDVWSMMAISGHWRPPIANRLWIHQHLWFPFSQNSINTRWYGCQYCLCLFPLHEFEVFDTMFSFVGAWPFYARHVLYTPRRALTHLYRRGQSEQNLLRPKNWRRFL